MGEVKHRSELIENLCMDTWKDLYRYIYYKVQNREEAQDITQETYAKAIAYLMNNEITVRDSGSYLKAIALNIIRDQWRNKKRKKSIINIDDIKQEELITEDFTDSLVSEDEVTKAIERLSKEQQTVITLRIIKGYSVADTALLMNKNKSTVRVLQFRALKQLEKIMDSGM